MPLTLTPRPILKHVTSHPPFDQLHPPKSLKCRDSHPAVHFPPSPSLTRTFSAHSPSTYDRSPIVVAPNSCALPERGCPGRTYVLDDPPTPKLTSSKQRPPIAGHLHPRALSRRKWVGYVGESDEDNTPTLPDATPTTLPPLIPDLTSSSSSESDESDSNSNLTVGHQRDSCTFNDPSIYSRTLHGLVIPQSQTKPRSNSVTLSFLPHPPSSPDVRRLAASNRRRSLRDVTVVEDDTAYHETKPKTYRSYPLSKSLSGLATEDDLGCLAGF
jgi:hypothetical protein